MSGTVNRGNAGRSGRFAALMGLDPDLTHEICKVRAKSSRGGSTEKFWDLKRVFSPLGTSLERRVCQLLPSSDV